MENRLYYGDNLEIMKNLLKEFPHGFIDLIYIDPPFNSKRDYNILYEDMIKNGNRETAMKEAFKDTWNNVEIYKQLDEIKNINFKLSKVLSVFRDTIDKSSISYLTMMAIRIYYMRKLLKDTGSFYLHCDPTMGHYLKIVCDLIFEKKFFKREIIWNLIGVSGYKSLVNSYVRGHDIIYYYTKTDNTIFNKEYLPYNDKQLKRFTKVDKDGRKYKAITTTRRIYLDEAKGVPVSDVWSDIASFQTIVNSPEILNYPTQKPEKLLERIIKISTNEGDIVADFFCGCGTAVAVAEKLKRKWIGADISHLAVGLIESKRLASLNAKYEVIGFPKDIAAAKRLADKDKRGRFRFQDWIIESCLLGHSNEKKTGDGGIDGHVVIAMPKSTSKYCIIEVKSGHTNIEHIRSFKSVIEKDQDIDGGIFVCFEEHITDGMRAEADAFGFIDCEGMFDRIPKLTIISVENLLGKKYPEWYHLSISGTYSNEK